MNCNGGVRPAAWAGLAPALILAGTAIFLFLLDSLSRRSMSREILAGTATAGALASLGVAVWFTVAGVGAPGMENGHGVITLFDGGNAFVGDGLFVVDQLALFFMIIVAVVTALVAVASYDYMDGHAHQAEYYSLLVLAATGMSLMAAANSLVTIFIALELASLRRTRSSRF